MEAAVEDIKVLTDESLKVGDFITQRYLSGKALKVLHSLCWHVSTFTQVLMTESRKLSAIVEAIVTQPPVTDTYSHKGCEDPPDVDEHVEDLEASVTSALIAGIIVHLTDEHLQVPLEETITESDDTQTDASQREVEGKVRYWRRRGDSDQHVAESHDDQTSDDRSLVLLRAVSDDATDESQQVDRGVEGRVNVPCRLLTQTELGRDEERQDRHHDVEAEALSHISERGCDQSLRMIFEHKFGVLG